MPAVNRNTVDRRGSMLPRLSLAGHVIQKKKVEVRMTKAAHLRISAIMKKDGNETMQSNSSVTTFFGAVPASNGPKVSGIPTLVKDQEMGGNRRSIVIKNRISMYVARSAALPSTKPKDDATVNSQYRPVPVVVASNLFPTLKGKTLVEQQNELRNQFRVDDGARQSILTHQGVAEADGYRGGSLIAGGDNRRRKSIYRRGHGVNLMGEGTQRLVQASILASRNDGNLAANCNLFMKPKTPARFSLCHRPSIAYFSGGVTPSPACKTDHNRDMVGFGTFARALPSHSHSTPIVDNVSAIQVPAVSEQAGPSGIQYGNRGNQLTNQFNIPRVKVTPPSPNKVMRKEPNMAAAAISHSPKRRTTMEMRDIYSNMSVEHLEGELADLLKRTTIVAELLATGSKNATPIIAGKPMERRQQIACSNNGLATIVENRESTSPLSSTERSEPNKGNVLETILEGSGDTEKASSNKKENVAPLKKMPTPKKMSKRNAATASEDEQPPHVPGFGFKNTYQLRPRRK